MTYKQFNKALTLLKKEMDREDAINKYLGKKMFLWEGSRIEVNSAPLVMLVIQLLSTMSGDKADWINWFIYENDWGKDGKEAGYESKMKKIKNNKDLWELIRG